MLSIVLWDGSRQAVALQTADIEQWTDYSPGLKSVTPLG
jgi:hypothetical protein